MSTRTAPRRSPTPLGHGALLAATALLVLVLLALHLVLGASRLGPGQVWDALLGRSQDEVHRTIVRQLRLPRTLIAALAGGMLGLSGALLQSVLRNPLAAPNLTGVSAGAIFASVVFLAYGPGLAGSGYAVPAVAVLGGGAAAALVYALSRAAGADPLRLVLFGVLISAILGSGTGLFVVINAQSLGAILPWMVGSLNGRVWLHWQVLWPWAALALPLGLAAGRLANALELGDDLAGGLGLRVEWVRFVLLGLAVVLASGAVSVVGAVAFVGLIAPHLARQLVGGDARRLFPLALLLGAGLLLAADIVAGLLRIQVPWRTLSAPAQLPVGVVTALLGAPFFLALVRRGR